MTKGIEKASFYRMTRVIHIDELSRPADNSPLFSCQHLSLILQVTILYPSIHNKDTHYSLSKHPLFPIGARHIAIFKLSHQLPSQNKEIFRLRGDCPWIKQPLFLIYRFAVSFPQKTFAAIVWPVDYQG